VSYRIGSAVHRGYRWVAAFVDPVRVWRALGALVWYARDVRAYRRAGGSAPWRDLWPSLHERTATSGIDAHYFFLNGWAARRIVALKPAVHVDVGSQTSFVNVLAASVPTVFVDYRPLTVRQAGLLPLGGDLLRLPFADRALRSVSCLHVIEHVGLGRYGDTLDPSGTRRAARELARVVAPGGYLLLGLPVGQPRTCFNALRIHDAEQVATDLFPELELVEFSAVTDEGQFLERTTPARVRGADYACGCFLFRRPSGD
jgi:SAM-dependent methyltransferase